jgi:hypothetical protein
LGVLLLLVALPALAAFESLAAVRSAAMDRTVWREFVKEPAFYDAFVAELRDRLGAVGAERDAALSALTSVYVQQQLTRVVDYVFDLLEGRNPEGILIDVPQPLVRLVQDNPAAGSVPRVVLPDGSLRLSVSVDDAQRAQALSAARNLNILLAVTGAVGIAAWVLSGIIGSGDVRSQLIWLGVTLMVASLFVLMVGALFQNGLVSGLRDAVMRDLSEAQSIERGILLGISNLLGRFGTAFIAAGAIPAVIGLVMAVIGGMMNPAPRLGSIGGGMNARSGVIRAE